MTDTILTELVKTIAEKAGSEICNKLMSVSDLDTQKRGLQDVRNTLEAALLDADSAQACTHSQRDVLEKLENGLAKIMDFQDAKAAKAKQQELVKGGKFTKKVRTFFSSSNQFVTPYRDARKIKAITAELNLIARNHSQFGTILGSSSVNQTRMLANEYGSQMNTDLIIGRDKDRDNMVCLLLDPLTSTEIPHVASIVGMGGIGKTTLAQYVYDDERVKSCFDVRLWVSATQDFDVKDVLQKILASASDENPLICEMDQLQRRLIREIAGRKFLLVLDGIWDHNSLRAKWFQLRSLLGVGSQGSKVLLTTRDDTVARKMGNQDPYVLCDLREEECWLLFQHLAYTKWHEPGLESIGKKIAQLCPKVPLVITAIGSLLAGKLTTQEWGDFRDNQLTNSALYGRDVMARLKLSYNELGTGLKLCLAFCSLFPKGFLYDKNDLIRLWIAMGYVKPEYANQRLEDVAEEYILCLTKRGFFRQMKVEHNLSNVVYMHNLMHDLVVSIAGFKYKPADSSMDEFDERVCHVSYLSKPNSLQEPWKVPSSLFKIKRLQSFLLPIPSRGLGTREHVGVFLKHDVFIARFRSLRTLRIHGLGITKLPTSLGDLIQLRYLDLSNNPISKLPTTITELVNLYLLNLSYCKSLKELPKDISKLVMLRHLILHGCLSLSHMPKGLGRLTELETMDRFVVNNSLGGSKADSVCSLADLHQFDNLKGVLRLLVISQSKDIVREAKAAKMESKENMTHLYIKFRDSTKQDEMMLDNLRPSANLRCLGIMNYAGEKLPRWMRDQLHWWLPNLVEIRIYNCAGSKYLCYFGRLSHLRSLELVGLKEVEYIENNVGSDSTATSVNELSCNPSFPSLTNLILSDMPKLKGWCSVPDTRHPSQFEVQHGLLNSMPAFPQLRALEIDMALLLSMSRVLLPSIASIERLTILGTLPGSTYTEERTTVCSTVSVRQQPPVVLLKAHLPNLTVLEFQHENQIKDFPEDFRDMSSLEHLHVYSCADLEVIPEWIDSLTSLKSLHLGRCPKLTSLPHEISNLSNLKSLALVKCSWQLAERCREPTGEDWPKIQHIPSIYIEPAHDDGSQYLSTLDERFDAAHKGLLL
ncbi:disease resistance protein RGA2-like [Silene latifolia]|uniref:disease resistance protein RGA2-like n=1 Tax=Silene latifolia TaxID=37657 RepID=UPI003D76DC30